MATTTYDALIMRAANDNGIPPAVLWGLLSLESSFDPTARGKNKNAAGQVVSVDRGIAQINDKAWPNVSDSQADDPSFAIPWAAEYLARESKKYGGNVVKFLTAYNSGHYEEIFVTKYGYAKKVMDRAANSPFGSSSYNPVDTTAEDFSAYKSTTISSKPVTQKLQDYWLDEFPEARGQFDPYKLRIGDVVTYIPPEMISVTSVNNINQFTALRQKESVKTKNGSETVQVTMNFYFNGEDQINGYMQNAPEGGIYWMDGLRALLAQFKRVPFLPVENEFLNRTNGIYAVAFASVSVDTVPGFPGLLNVSCVFYEFDTTSMLGFPSFMYDGMIMYPLFRWYYQQMLVGAQDDDKKTGRDGRSATKLRRVSTPLQQDVSFAILDEAVLQANRNTMKNWTSEQLDRAFVPIKLIGDYVISSFNATFGNLLTPLTLDSIGKPTFQYFGGLDTRIHLSIETQSEEIAIQLRSLNETMEHYSRTYRNRFVGGYLKVQNDLVNMMGIDFCMIEQLAIATVPGFPGTYMIELNLISFEKTQMDGERLHGWNGFDSQKGIVPTIESFPGQDPAHFSNFIVQEVRAETFLDSLELYPDLELPTYAQVDEQIKLVNAFRKKTNWPALPLTALGKVNPRAVYVDPDFYMIYPDMADYMEGGPGDILGVDLDAMIDGKSMTVERLNKGTKSVESKDFTRNVWSAPTPTRGKWAALREKALGYNYMRDSWKYAQQPNGTYDPENYTVDYIRSQPAYDDLKYQMCYDAFKYSKRGTLLRAFPTYVLMIIDEGQWVNSRKIWNNYYAYHVVNSISVVRDRKNPADTAYVSLSNVYGSLNYMNRPPYRQSEFLKKGKDGQVAQLLAGMHEAFDYIYPSLENEKAKWEQRATLLTAGFLQAGARVHIRLGYGSCASDMPTVFNGVVTETDAADEMTIICQGDGVELINSDIPAGANELNNWIEEGDSGQALIQYFMSKPSNDYIFNSTDRVAAALGRNNLYGIEHFGYVRQASDTDWNLGNFWNQLGHTLTGWSSNWVDPNSKGWNRGNLDPYDVVKNIYSTAGAASTAGLTNQNNGGEVINTFLSGKSPWDVFRLMAKIHTDYVISPVYHNFHSTLFFGMPHWLCKQGWVLPAGAKGEAINDYKDFTKPFTQIHFLNSMEDIIHNGIKAIGSDLITHCYPMYYQGSGSKTGPTVAPDVYADQRIRPELQKSKIVDSTVVQSYFAGWLWQMPFQTVAAIEGKIEYVWDKAANIAADILDGAHHEWDKLETWLTGVNHTTPNLKRRNARWDILTRGQQQAMAFAITTVAESFKDMYQGSLLILGDTAIKPHDVIYLNDYYTQMHGVIECQRVVHTMSFETGFVTELTPDLAVAQIYADTYRSGEMDPLVSSKFNGIKACMEVGALASVRGMRLFLGWSTLKSYNNAVRLGKAALKVGTKVEVVNKAVTAGRTAFSAASELPTFAKMGEFFKGARTTIKSAITGVEVATMEGTLAMGPEVWVGILIEGAIFVVADLAIDELLDWLNMDHNCIKIFPLYYKGHPYVAGISGHKNLIPGHQDEFIYGDPNYTLEGDPVVNNWQTP